MKFSHCLISTFCGFVVVYFASLDIGSVNTFDAGLPRLPSQKRSEVRSGKVTIIRNPDPKPTINPSNEQSIQKPVDTTLHVPVQPRPPITSITDTPSPAQFASEQITPTDGTQGSAVTNLEVLIRGVSSDDQLQRLLLSEGCKIIAVKVEGKKVVEAFLPDRFNNFVRASGKRGTEQFELFRRTHPTNQFVWFRWHDLDRDIGSIACAELRGLSEKPDGYFIYLILSRALSADVQRLLSRKAFEARLPPEDIAYAQILLETDGSNFRAEVLQVKPRPDRDHAFESGNQTDTETEEFLSM
jgi:hypothetical protein